MRFNNETPDHEVQSWKKDCEFWLERGQRDIDQGNLHGLTSAQHAEIMRDWQDTLAEANAELSRRGKSA